MEEQFDVLNQDGTFSGIKKTRDEVHKSGDWHRTVYVWIVNSKKEVLMQLRSPLKVNNPNLWDISSAGHISAGEDGKTGAVREVKEELGIDISPDELIYIGETKSAESYENETYRDNEIHDVFIIFRDVDINNITLQKEEVTDAKWISCLDLKKDLIENHKKYVDHKDAYSMLFSYVETNATIYEDDNVIVKPSTIEGFGVFAKREFKKGEIVLVWHPTTLTEEKLSIISEDQKRYINTLEDGTSVLMNIPERYINSSNQPNTHVIKATDVAARDILIGEEITSNYTFK